MPQTIDKETAEALKSQHGHGIESFQLDCLDYEIALRPPKADEWRLFRDDSAGAVDSRVATLALACVVFPSVAQVSEDAKKRPGLLTTIGNQVAQLAGFQGEVKRKKL